VLAEQSLLTPARVLAEQPLLTPARVLAEQSLLTPARVLATFCSFLSSRNYENGILFLKPRTRYDVGPTNRHTISISNLDVSFDLDYLFSLFYI
jgi:hypothetical protein